jgi:hypothetical protein
MAGTDNPDERQPLLGASEGYQHPTSNEADNDLDTSVKKRNWKKIAFRGVLFLLGAAILGIFVKSFIDAGDVDVCILHEYAALSISEHL